eukprot:gene10772-1025_t
MSMLTASGRPDGQAPGNDDDNDDDINIIHNLAQANRGSLADGYHRANWRSVSRAANRFPYPAPAPTHVGAVRAMAPTRAPTLDPSRGGVDGGSLGDREGEGADGGSLGSRARRRPA